MSLMIVFSKFIDSGSTTINSRYSFIVFSTSASSNLFLTSGTCARNWQPWKRCNVGVVCAFFVLFCTVEMPFWFYIEDEKGALWRVRRRFVLFCFFLFNYSAKHTMYFGRGYFATRHDHRTIDGRRHTGRPCFIENPIIECKRSGKLKTKPFSWSWQIFTSQKTLFEVIKTVQEIREMFWTWVNTVLFELITGLKFTESKNRFYL